MLSAPRFIELGELFQTLAEDLIREQQRLDQEYVDGLLEFAPILQAAREQGVEPLARSLAPAALNLTQVEIRLDFHFAHHLTSEFALGLRLINLGYWRKYSLSEFIRNNLQLTIQRAPFPPGMLQATKEQP